MITIYAKNGTAKCQARKLTLSEEFMGVAKMVVDIASPEPIDFAIDDYIDYSYNSRRYLLKDLAKVKKQARRNTYGEAFVYTCTFYEQTWELENCPFLDLVPAQQTAVYSSLPDVTVYAKPQNIVERVQANLDSFYGANEWEVLIPNYITDPTVLKLLDTYKDISLSQATCKGALDEIYKQWGLSWIFVTAYGRKQIYVAFAADISNLFKYGKGQGLRAITVEQKDTASLATRIYPYGSTENLPARWYNEHPLNSDPKYIDEFQYIPHLMLPPSLWHGGTPAGNYVEDADAIAKYGLRPKTIYFEGGEYEKIMPSISGLTAKAIRDAKTEIGDTDNVPSTTLYPDSTRMDRVLTGDSLEDNGVSSVYEPYSESTTFSVPNPDEPTSTTIHLINEGVGGSTTRRMEEYTYESDLSLDLGTAQLSHIAQYRFTFSGISLTTSVPSELVGALDTLVITPTITGYLVNGGTGVDRFFVSSNPITLNATSGNFTNVVSLDSIIGSDEAIYKVFQAQSDALPSNLWLHLGFIIKYKFKAASSVTGGDVTLSINSGQGVCSRGVTQIANRFTVKLRQIGFDIMDCKKSANENRQLNMKSGLCAGYSFNILKTQYNSSDDSWTLTCYRTTDTDLKIAFPNADRHIVAEDEFVLTGIEMPDIYVYAAMEKLYEQALLTLAELSKPKLVYAPDIDNQKMAASPQVLHAGMLLQTEDTDLTLPALLPVDSLQITEDGEKLREFSVSLRNEKTDNLLRQIMTIAHTEQGGVSERQVSTAINQALNTYTSIQENGQGGSGSGNFGISFQPQGDGNAITEIVQSTPGLFYAKKEKTFVDLLSEQTVTGKKYLSSLLISALLAIPTVTPSPDSADANRSFLWCDTAGNYAETPSGGGGGGGETLTVTKNGQSWLSYNGSQAVTLNLVVPTKVSDLDNDSGFLTASTLPIASANTLGGIKVGNNLTIDANGVLSAANSYVLPTASSSVKGGIKVGSTLTISNEVLNVVVGSVAQSNTGFVTGGDVYSAIAAAVTSALHYRGMSSTALTDGGTETAIIGGVALTPQSGDVVIYNGFEFLWENSVWNKLGDDSSYALKTIQINGDGTYITGGGDLTATRTLTLSAAVIASLGKADSAYQKPSGGIPASDLADAYLKLSGGTMSNTNLVTNMNADLLDGLHSHEQRRLGNAKDTLGTSAIAYGVQADGSGPYSVAIGYSAKASGQYSGAFGYGASAEAERAYVIGGHNNKALTNYSLAFGGSGNYAGLLSGDSAKPYVKLAEYTPKVITYNGSTVCGIWNRYNDATSVTFSINGTSYTVNYPSGSPTYWRALVVVEVTGDIMVPTTTSPFERYYIRTGSGYSIGTVSKGTVTSLGNNLYAIVSGTTNNAETWPDDKPLNSYTKVGLWTKTATTNVGQSAVALGSNTRASGIGAYALGYQSVASGDYSTAFGYCPFAAGAYSTALGYMTLATGSYGLATGCRSVSIGSYSVATGMSSIASGAYSLVTGAYAVGSNTDSVAIGSHSKSMHNSSKVLATYGTSGASDQTVLGKYNAITTDALVVGWGTADNARANIMTLSTAGRLTLSDGLTVGGSIDLPNAGRINFKDSNGTARTALYYTSSNDLYIGSGTNAVATGYTYIYGKGRIYFNASSDSTAKWITFADKNMSGINTILPPDNNVGTLGGANNKFLAAYATTFYGALSGNASTATKLETARTLWGQSFDGSANVSGSLTGVTDITASGLATLPSIHAATSLSIPKVAPDTTAAWYDSSHAYLWSDSEGNYAESASGGGGGGGETLTITKNGSAWLSYNGSTAVSLNLVVPTTLAELTDDSTHRVVTDTQISNWGTAYTNNHTHSNKSVLDGIASTDITAWNGKYAKPSGGIPKTDLASAVQTTLSNADTAYGWGNHASAGYLTSSSLDGYVNEIATGTGNYISGVSKSGKKLTFTYGTLPTTIAWGSVTGKPTTISGYGITDAKIETPSGTSNRKITLGSNNFTIYSWALASAKPSYTFSEIGSKPTTIAGYGITDAIQKGEYYMPTNSFGSTLKGMQINSLNDGFYAMDKRTTVTLTGFDNNTNASVLFDADYESKRIISQGGTGVVLMEVASGTFATYTYGYIYVSFYNNASPASVSIRAYGTKSGTEGWYNYGAATDILNTTGSHCFRAYNGNIYNIKKWEITIVAKSDIDCWVTQIEHSWTRGSQAMMSAVTKFAIKQDLYGEVVAPKFTVRGGTSSQFLKADGSVDSNTYALSSALGSYVPTSRKVNNKALSADITLSLDDIADGSTRKLADYLPLTAGSTKALTGDLYFDSSTAAKNIYYKDSSNANLRALIMQPAGSLVVGYDLPAKSYSLYLDGYNEYIRFGSTRQYSLLFNGADGTVRSSTGANLVSLGYRSNNTLFPFNYIYSTYSVASKALAAQTGKIMLGLATFTIANTKKARTFAIKIPYNGSPHCFKIGIYSSYGTLPSSTITVSTGGLNKTASAYAALYPSYSVEGSFAGRVAFARDANTDAANFYILIGSYADGYEYQSGYIAIEEVIVTSNPSGSDEYLQFAYTLSDLDSESTFTKISECANADAHFASVTAPKGYFETELVIPKVAPSSPDSSKAYLWIDTNGNYAELPNA